MPDVTEPNLLLAALSPDERARILASGEDVAVRAGTVLHEADSVPEHAFFLRNGLVSLMIEMRDGDTVETSMAGFEGVIGGEAALGADRIRTRAVVTVSGTALRVPVLALRELAAQSSGVRAVLSQYRDQMLGQAQQSAACGVLHKLEGRLCRWLLQALDRVAGNAIPLTQEHLAQRLGVHRATLNEASAHLRRDGVIQEGRRGFIHVKDRESLRNCACECYAHMKPAAIQPAGG